MVLRSALLKGVVVVVVAVAVVVVVRPLGACRKRVGGGVGARGWG